jgi:hypothetical protein
MAEESAVNYWEVRTRSPCLPEWLLSLRIEVRERRL